MQKQAFQAFVLISGLLLLCCSKQATPTGPAPQPPATAHPCKSQSECPGEVCDFLFPKDGEVGRCLTSCKSNKDCNDPNHPVCNPISGACEEDCSGDIQQFCSSRSVQGSQCIVTGTGSSRIGYCAIVSTTCSGNFKPSGGFCKFAVPETGICSGGGQTPDPITGTCEISCTTSQDNCNSTLSSLQIPSSSSSSSSTQTYKCSPITGTCVQQCAVPPQPGTPDPCSNNNIRNRCYASGYLSGANGTCEKTCTTLGSCSNISLICAEGVCQHACQKDGDCVFASDRTRCDPITNSCGKKCSTQETCTPSGLVCSPVSAVCVPGCASPQNCPSQDSLRGGCYNASLGTATTYSCEISCLNPATGHNPPVKSTCGQGQYCSNNPNSGSSFVSGYCGLSCTNNQCDSPYNQCLPTSVCSL